MAGTTATATLSTGINSSNNSAFVSYNRSSPHHTNTNTSTTSSNSSLIAFELDDLVWVKLESYPWWPARVINDPNDNYHGSYSSFKRKSNKNSYTCFYCVELFGQVNSHHWCPDSHMFKYEGKKAFMTYAQDQVNRANSKLIKQQLVEHFKLNVQPDLRGYWESAVSHADSYARDKQVYVSNNNTNGHQSYHHSQPYHHQFYEEQNMCLKRKSSIDEMNFSSNAMVGDEEIHHVAAPMLRVVDDSHKSKKFAMTKNNMVGTSSSSAFKKENAHMRTNGHYSNYSSMMPTGQQYYDNVQAFSNYKQQGATASDYNHSYGTDIQNDDGIIQNQIAQQQYDYAINHQGYATTYSHPQMTDYNGNTLKHSSSYSNLPNHQYIGDDGGSYHQIDGGVVEQNQSSSDDEDDEDEDEEEDNDSLLKAPTSIYQDDEPPGGGSTNSQRNSISYYYQDQNGASSKQHYENEIEERSSEDEEESEGHTTITRILNEELAKKNRKQFVETPPLPPPPPLPAPATTVAKSVDTKSNQYMSSSQHLPDNQLKLKIKLPKQDIVEQSFKSNSKKTKNLSDSSGDEDENQRENKKSEIKGEPFDSSAMMDTKKNSQMLAVASSMSHLLQSTSISQSNTGYASNRKSKHHRGDDEDSSSSSSSSSSSASSSCSSSCSSDTESEQKAASKLPKEAKKAAANTQSTIRPNGFRKETEVREGRVVQPSLLKSKKNPSKSKSAASNLKSTNMLFSKKVKSSLGDAAAVVASSMSKLNEQALNDPNSYMYGPNQPQSTETYLIDRYKYAVNHINQGLSIEEACNKYRISRGALMKCLSGGTAPRGKKTRLTEQEENQIVEWLISMKDLKYNDAIQMTFEQVVRIFEETKRQNPFNNGKPSMDWWYDFLSRHPQIMASKPDWLMRGKVNDQYIKDVQSGHLKCTKFRRALLSAIQYKNSLSNGGSGGDNGCSSTSESASSSSADMKLLFPLSSSQSTQQSTSQPRSFMQTVAKSKFQHLHSVTPTSSKSKKSVNLKKKNAAYSTSFSGVSIASDHHHDNKPLSMTSVKVEPLQPITNFASKKEPMFGYQQGSRDARSDETISDGERNEDEDDDDEDNLDSVSPTSLMDQFVAPSIGLINQNIFLSENNNSLYSQSNNNNSNDLLDTHFDKLINPNELIMNPNFRTNGGASQSAYYSYDNNINDDFTIQNMLMTNGVSTEASGGSSSLASSSSSTSTSNNNGHIKTGGGGSSSNFASSSGYHLMIRDDDEEDSTNTTRASPVDINSTAPFLVNHHHHHHNLHHDDDEDSNDSLILNGNPNEVVPNFYDPTTFLS